MIRAGDINFETTWQNIHPGGEVWEPGTAASVATGEWRSNRPVWDSAKCTQCLLCAPYCPDSSIPVQNGKRLEFDFMHCKGCGICVTACPFDAIKMVKEG